MTSPPTPTAPGAGPEEQAAYRQRRQVAGWRLLAVLLAGTTVQFTGLDAVNAPVIQAVLVVGPYLGYHAALGLLVPRPPGGFTGKRSSRSPQRRPPGQGCGVDWLDVVCDAAWFVPFMTVLLWLQRSDDDFLRAALAMGAVGVAGLVVTVGLLELRRRRQPTRQAGCDQPGPRRSP